MKQPVSNLYIFHVVLPDGITSTIDIYAIDLNEAVSKLKKDNGVKYPNYELVRIIYCGRGGGNVNIH